MFTNSGDKIVHTTNWTTGDLMVNYFEWLSKQLDGKPCALLLDTYRAHKQANMIFEARKRNIELIFYYCVSQVYINRLIDSFLII